MDFYGFENRETFVDEAFATNIPPGDRSNNGRSLPKVGGKGGGGAKGADDLPVPHRVDLDSNRKIDKDDAPAQVGADIGKVYEGRLFIDKIDPTLHKRGITSPNGLWSGTPPTKGKDGKAVPIWEYRGQYVEADGKAGITCKAELESFKENIRGTEAGVELDKLHASTADNPDWRVVWNSGDVEKPENIAWGEVLPDPAKDTADGAGNTFGLSDFKTLLAKLRGKIAEAAKEIENLIQQVLAGNPDAVKQLIRQLAFVGSLSKNVAAALVGQINIQLQKEEEKISKETQTITGQTPGNKDVAGYNAKNAKLEELRSCRAALQSLRETVANYLRDIASGEQYIDNLGSIVTEMNRHEVEQSRYS